MRDIVMYFKLFLKDLVFWTTWWLKYVSLVEGHAGYPGQVYAGGIRRKMQWNSRLLIGFGQELNPA